MNSIDIILRIRSKIIEHENNLKKIGKIFSICALLYVACYVSNLLSSVELEIMHQNLLPITAFFVILSTSFVFTNAYAYKLILCMVCELDIKYSEVADLYIASNIYKYLPGNVLHFVGRNVIAKKYGINQKNIVLSTIYEVLIIITATVSLLIIVYTMYLDQWIVSLLILLATLLVFYRKRLFWVYCILLVSMLLNNCILVILFNMYEGSRCFSNFLEITIIQSISWLIGFVTPGAPGGIGVKEFVIIKISPPRFVEIIVIVAVMHRIILVIADGMGYVLLLIFERSRKVIAEKRKIREKG